MINEVYTALNMIDFGPDNPPGGPPMVEGFTHIPHRFALGFSETPRGDDIHWSMTGDNQKLCTAGAAGRRLTPTGRPCAMYAARQHCFRCAADHRQPRPVLILYFDLHDRGRCNARRRAKWCLYKELERYSIERKNSLLK
ncbi:hypothetical protein MJ560_22095 [Klebsiella pneumoniae]|nr:hypothetical protein MJ560_22095 [Klebsiella pneumoniae]